MPCHSAMIDKVLTVSPEDSVDSVLDLMKKKNIEYAPVVDKDNKLVGLFSIQILMKNLLPVSIAMADGLQLDMTMRAAPGIAKRLKKVGPLKVADIMDRRANLVNPETPTWEGVNLLVQYGPPLLVVDAESGTLTGVITAQSALDELQRLKESDQ
jgi:CBS-domain-containing membrane protein